MTYDVKRYFGVSVLYTYADIAVFFCRDGSAGLEGYSALGGFLLENESIEQACKRHCEVKSGLVIDPEKLAFVGDAKDMRFLQSTGKDEPIQTLHFLYELSDVEYMNITPQGGHTNTVEMTAERFAEKRAAGEVPDTADADQVQKTMEEWI